MCDIQEKLPTLTSFSLLKIFKINKENVAINLHIYYIFNHIAYMNHASKKILTAAISVCVWLDQ